AAVVFVDVLSSAAVLTVGRATVALAPLALTLTVQVLAVTAPVNVIVPSDACPDIGSTMAVATPAAIIARLIRMFISSPLEIAAKAKGSYCHAVAAASQLT